MRSIRHLLLPVLALGLSAAVPATAEAAPVRVVVSAPAMAERIWVPGHFEVRPGGVAWVAGHYKVVPARVVTVPGRWEMRAGRRVWVPAPRR